MSTVMGRPAEGQCDAPAGTAGYAGGHCRCVICACCGHHTGNAHQGGQQRVEMTRLGVLPWVPGPRGEAGSGRWRREPGARIAREHCG